METAQGIFSMCRSEVQKGRLYLSLNKTAGVAATRLQSLVACAVAFVVIESSPQAFARMLPMSDFTAMANRCGPSVDKTTLASVAATESGFETLSVHDNTTGSSATMDGPEQGAAAVKRLIDRGHSLDVGLMQINSTNFAALGLDATSAFDPCASIAAAAKLLSQAYVGGPTHEAQQAALRGALSTYNTGDAERGIRNGYVRRVELAAARVVPAIDTASLHVTASVPSSPDPKQPSDWEVWSEKVKGSPSTGDAESAIINFDGENNHG